MSRSSRVAALAAALVAMHAAPVLGEEVPCAPVKPCEVGDDAAVPADAGAPADLGAEAKALYSVVACTGAPLPEGVDAQAVAAFCKRQGPALAAYRDGPLAQGAAFLARVRPATGLPTTVVFPFGADLLAALTTYPDARNVTTISPERAGDPRRLATVKGGAPLARSLEAIRASTRGPLAVTGASAGTPPKAAAGELPGPLASFLTALAVHGYEPVSLRYFTLQPDGSLHYLTAAELAAGKDAAFANSELVFVRRGGDPRKDARVHRHVATELSDAALARSPGIAKHLESKGRFAALTRAAGDRLSRGDFSRLREVLLARMTFCVSEGPGLPAEAARQAGLVQERHDRPGQPPLTVTRKP